METVLITGGSGLVGKHLAKMFVGAGYKVLIATRRLPSGAANDQESIAYILWDPQHYMIDPVVMASVDHIVNLAGAGVAEKRWTTQRKKEIIQSRVDSGRTLVKALSEHKGKVCTVVQASAIGWYGPDHDPIRAFEETDPMDHAYLGTTCGAWENSVAELPSIGIRLVTLRIGIVLSTEGGAMKEFMKPLRWGIAPVFAAGKQIVSWIHINDLCRLILFAIQQNNMSGIYNAVAPNPVPQRMLIKTLAKVVRPPFFVLAWVPAFVLKAMLGEMSIEILKSAYVSATKIMKAGFDFHFPTIDEAFEHLVKNAKDSTSN